MSRACITYAWQGCLPPLCMFGAPSLRQACEQGLEQVLNKALSPLLRLALIP